MSTGGDGKKSNAASKCDKCGNRHEGDCFPSYRTCGKVHRGFCRYANPIPNTLTARAGTEPSPADLTARYNAQQFGDQQGYQRAYQEMRSMAMGPPMAPGMGGPSFGAYGGPPPQHPGPYGGYGRFGGPGGFGGPVNRGWANPGWANSGFANIGWGSQSWVNQGGVYQMHGQFSPGYGNFPIPPMGQDFVAPLEVTSAGIENPISKSSKVRARKKARQQRKKPAKEATSGTAHPVFPIRKAEEQVESAEATVSAPPRREAMEDAVPQTGVEPRFFPARFFINEVIASPVGFELPRDRAQVEQIARALDHFGLDRLLTLSELAYRHGTSVVFEALKHDLQNVQITEEAVQAALRVPELR